MNKTCSNCKHWDDVFNNHPNPITWGACALTQSEGTSVMTAEPTENTEAFAYGFFPEEDEDSFARLILLTGPDFSCSQWEEDNR